jgi:pyruvate dehydrogenase E2 component (dihydrolipoamide acetyltransferase)
MSIEIKMPALSPTMEEGTLAKWLVEAGDTVKAGDLMAEIETDKATMEFEAVDEGTIAEILIAEGTDNVKVGTVIARLAADGEDAGTTAPAQAPAPASTEAPVKRDAVEAEDHGLPPMNGTQANPAQESPAPAPAVPRGEGERVKASPLARRIAAEKGVELGALTGSGPNGRIVRADVEAAKPGAAPAPKAQAAAPPAPVAPAPAAEVPKAAGPVWYDESIPHEEEKLSNIRKTIARRLTEAKQTIPHIYLTVDVRLDALLKLRSELNAGLERRGVKLSVNDLLVKALGVALIQVPKCNVTYAGDKLVKYSRADVSVAVSTPSGLITPIVRDAANASVSSISTVMKDLATRARDGKLKPEEYQGGTASISNMGMYGITQFDAVINPPQGMILAVGAGEKRPVVTNDALGIATVMSATGSFDHRAIDGADGAELMKVFKELVEAPLALLA